MNLALLLKQPLLKKYLLNQLAYYADGWYFFDSKRGKNNHTQDNQDNVQNQYRLSAVNASKAKIVIVAKKHYSESWQSYTSVSKKELLQILALQKNNEKVTTLFKIINKNTTDSYDVKKIIFNSKLIDELGEQRILIPETELFNHQQKLLNNNTWLLSLETPTGILFSSSFANKSVNAYAKGLISKIDTFKLSSGLPAEISPKHISQASYGSFLFNCFIHQRLDQLYRKMAFNVKSWFRANDLHLLYWAPLLSATIFYLFSNSYLWLKNYNIEDEFAKQSNEITTLLNNKYQQDKQKKLLNLLDNEFLKTSIVHNHWSVIYQLIESGMVIESIKFAKNVITIRGQSTNASRVLTQIAKNSKVSSASFKGSVLKSRGKETFTLEIIPENKPKGKARLAQGNITS